LFGFPLIGIALKGASSLIKEPLTVKYKNVKVKKENAKDDMISNKRKREKLKRVSHILGHFECIVANFASKLKLSCEGLDPHRELSFLSTSIKELISLFGKRHQNEWKVHTTKSLF
jgi:hypothetical protein